MTKRFAMFNVLALMCFPFAARASLITGTLNIAGTIDLTQAGITFASSGLFNINAPASAQGGSFATLAGTTGTLKNITNPPDATGSLDVLDFMTFSAVPNISITLTFLNPGIDGSSGCTSTPPAAGQVCTPDVPAQSPLNFQNTSATSTSVEFLLRGTEIDSLTGDTTPIMGSFTMSLSNMNFQDVLSTISTGGTVPMGFAGSFSTTAPPPPSVPEPNTWTAIAIGTAGMGWRYRRSLKRR